MEKYQEILNYWFGNIESELEPLAEKRTLWFTKSDSIDNEIKKLFLEDLEKVNTSEYETFLDNPDSSLALIILIDQFSRNIFRNNKRSFENDNLALKYALEAIDKGFDQKVNPIKRLFFYLPLEHSEDIKMQEKSVELTKKLVDESSDESKKELENFLNYAKSHYEIIKRFGRFPHRNKIVDRKSTDEEVLFLTQPNSGF